MRHRGGWLVFLIVGPGCGIDAVGLAEPSSISPSGGDASSGDAPPIVIACGTSGTTCTSALAPGFKRARAAARRTSAYEVNGTGCTAVNAGSVVTTA